MRTSSRAAEDGRERPGSGSPRATRYLRRVARGSRLMMGEEWAASANELAVPVVAARQWLCKKVARTMRTSMRAA